MIATRALAPRKTTKSDTKITSCCLMHYAVMSVITCVVIEVFVLFSANSIVNMRFKCFCEHS